MNRYQEASEVNMRNAMGKSHVQILMFMHLAMALIWALLDIADAIRGNK